MNYINTETVCSDYRFLQRMNIRITLYGAKSVEQTSEYIHMHNNGPMKNRIIFIGFKSD